MDELVGRHELNHVMEAVLAFGADLLKLRNYVAGARQTRRRTNSFYKRVSDVLDVMHNECTPTD